MNTSPNRSVMNNTPPQATALPKLSNVRFHSAWTHSDPDFCYANSLVCQKRFEEARSLLRKTMPVARRVLGESNSLTLKMRWCYADALYTDDRASLDDLCEAVTTLEDAERIARRVLGGANPTTKGIETALRKIRAALRAREPK